MDIIQKIITYLQSLPPLWKAVTVILLCAASGILIFFVTSCGVSRVSVINNQSDNNKTSIDVDDRPNTSATLDSLTFKPKF